MSMSIQRTTVGWISFWIAIAGAIIPFVIPIFIPGLRGFFGFRGPIVIWILESVALITGIVGRRTMPGKIGMSLAIIISLFLVGYLLFGGVTVTPTS